VSEPQQASGDNQELTPENLAYEFEKLAQAFRHLRLSERAGAAYSEDVRFLHAEAQRVNRLYLRDEEEGTPL
jgi:hypothetical protein